MTLYEFLIYMINKIIERMLWSCKFILLVVIEIQLLVTEFKICCMNCDCLNSVSLQDAWSMLFIKNIRRNQDIIVPTCRYCD